MSSLKLEKEGLFEDGSMDVAGTFSTLVSWLGLKYGSRLPVR